MNLAILQARMSSTRLPGKVLKTIVGKPMLALHLERLARSKMIDKLVVATSIGPEDNAIAELCDSLGVSCYQGSLDNVLDRFYQVAQQYQPTQVIRLTADCPLACPALIDTVVNLHIDNKNDYTTQPLPMSYPDGLDVEVLTFSALEKAWKNATSAYEQEHVTPYLTAHPQQFKLGHYQSQIDLSMHRWTVDYPEDFELVKFVYENLYDDDVNFDSDQILALLSRHPQVFELNQHRR